MNIFNLVPIMLIATGVLGIIFIVLGFTWDQEIALNLDHY